MGYQFGLIALLFYLSLSIEARTEVLPVLVFHCWRFLLTALSMPRFLCTFGFILYMAGRFYDAL
jgi:hypothetical protein